MEPTAAPATRPDASAPPAAAHCSRSTSTVDSWSEICTTPEVAPTRPATPLIADFLWRIEHGLCVEGGFAMVTGKPGVGKSVTGPSGADRGGPPAGRQVLNHRRRA